MEIKIDEKILERIKKIDWFNNCGSELKIESNFEIERVNSWQEAVMSCADQNWENTRMNARNDLTSYLHDNYSDEYSNYWNQLAGEARFFVVEKILPGIIQKLESLRIDALLIKSIRWNLLNTIILQAYSNDIKNLPDFYLKILSIYEAGNFPCGWSGEWPEGKLIVY